VNHLDAFNVIDGLDDFLSVFAGCCVDGNVADCVMVADSDDINRPDVSTDTAYGGRQLAERAGAARKFHAQGQTVARAGRTLHLTGVIPFPSGLACLCAETLTLATVPRQASDTHFFLAVVRARFICSASFGSNPLRVANSSE